MQRVNLPSEWVERARVFLTDAERHLGEGHYWLTCFEAQQAAEFYVKSLLIALTGVYPYTHDIVELLDTLASVGVSIPDEMRIYGDVLTPHYTMARYPGRKPFTYDKGRGERCLEGAKKIASWVEKIADP